MKHRAYIGEPKKEPKKKKLAFPPDSQMKSQNPLYEKKTISTPQFLSMTFLKKKLEEVLILYIKI